MRQKLYDLWMPPPDPPTESEKAVIELLRKLQDERKPKPPEPTHSIR
jgi:hypothetical protein